VLHFLVKAEVRSLGDSETSVTVTSAVVAEGVAADGVEIEAVGRGGAVVDGVAMDSLATLGITVICMCPDSSHRKR
jgi:hypothetical protein